MSKDGLKHRKKLSKESDNRKDEKGIQSVGVTKERIVGRIGLAAIIMFIVYYTSKSKENDSVIFAAQNEYIPWRGQQVPCAKNPDQKFPGCSPQKCGRIVTDTVVSAAEVNKLIEIAKKGLAHGRSNGGASILDLHSGALSYGENFVNIYKVIDGNNPVFTTDDFQVYKSIKNKIRKKIAEEFKLQETKLYLTHPTFFSEITAKEAKTSHDEYWHVHIDKEQYKLFHYTSLLYLNDYDINFKGGRFVFVDKANVTVEPRAGRVSIFTSGHEHPHYVEKVTSGTRYAITIPFTCDPQYAINDPYNK